MTNTNNKFTIITNCQVINCTVCNHFTKFASLDHSLLDWYPSIATVL